MSTAIKVADVGDIDDEGALLVSSATTGWNDDIAVFFSNGEYRALNNTCTHEDAPLSEGWVEGDEVECPLHSSRFSLCTGAALCLPATRPARTHRVEVRGDEVWLLVGVPVEGAVAEAD